MSFGARYSQALDRVLDAGAVVAGACLIFQVVSVSVDVLLRYFFASPIKAVIALNEWSLLYIAFLGAGWLQREVGHVRVDILPNLLGRRANLFIGLFGVALGLATCAVLMWFGTVVTWEKYVGEVYDFFKLEDFVIWPVYLVIPLGALLWFLTLAREAYRAVRAHGRDRVGEVTDL